MISRRSARTCGWSTLSMYRLARSVRTVRSSSWEETSVLLRTEVMPVMIAPELLVTPSTMSRNNCSLSANCLYTVCLETAASAATWSMLVLRAGGRLYCVGQDHVVAFDFDTGNFVGPVVQLARLNGQALVLVPEHAGGLGHLPA